MSYANEDTGSLDFLEHVWQKGLKQITAQAEQVMEGTFGRVTLRCVADKAGLPWISFECITKLFKPDKWRSDTATEYVSYRIAPDGDAEDALYRSSCAMSLDMPKIMFEEVISNWPDSADEQESAFSPSVKS